MDVRLLGTVQVRGASGAVISPGPQLRGVLAALALDAGAIVSSTRLAACVWDGDPPSSSAIQVAVSKLRRVLADLGEPDRVVGHPTGYCLDVDREAVDAFRFERSIDAARALRPDWPAVVARLEPALAMWSGEPLGGVPDTQALQVARTRLEELHRLAAEDLAEARLGCGEHARVVAELEALVSAEPLRERRWALLLRALYGSGRQADALAAYHRARTLLVEEVGAEPGPELRELYDAALAQDESVLVTGARGTSPVGTSFRRRGNLRHPVEPCIGRSDELLAIGALLDDRRMVTIVGPGGVGKTRVASEVAADRRDRTPDGIWWVNLAPERTGEDALRALERALDLGDDGVDRNPLDAVCSALEARDALLVLDNCEHLVDDLASAVGEVLSRCGTVTVLATSREALRVSGESVFALPPLDPAGAVELFQARVVAPIDGDAVADGVVAEICERLDRLPLALELAAARTRHLRLDELLGRLVDRFVVLADGPRDAPDRQRDLEAVADWSYELLDEPEQLVFERLSVFSDGATIAAARAVCTTGPVAPGDVEGLVHRLVDKSLVVADRSAPATRYRMLQTLADFAAARLAARGEVGRAHRAHAEWVRSLARTVSWSRRVTGPAVAAIHEEDAAVREAISWAVDADPSIAVEICDDLAPYWFGAMRVSTGWDLLRTAVEAADGGDPWRYSALAWASVFATLVQEIELADRYAAEATRYEEQRGDRERLGRLCLLQAVAAGYRPDGELSHWVEAAHGHLTAADAPLGLGHLHFAEGAGLLVAGELEPAAARLREAIEVFRRIEDHLGLILAISRLGELAWRLDDLDLFADMHAQLLELGLASRTQGVITGATARLGLARLRQGDTETAEELARTALRDCGDTFMPVINGYAFRTAALVDLEAGHIGAGRAALASAIDAFERGTGSVGLGQAALCWIDLSRSHLTTGDLDAARAAADTARELARATADPWVRSQAERHSNDLAELSC